MAHAQAHQQLAYGHASWADWEKAKPHAVKAAETWSAWGLETASYVCEGRAEWEESENWIREKATSYPTSSGNEWYFWCRRTGRGDVEAARKLAQEFHSVSITTLTFERLFQLGSFFLLEDKPGDALGTFRRSFDAQPTFVCAYMLAQLSRELEDEPSREEVIAATEEAIEKAQEDPERKGRLDEVGLAILELLKTGDTSGERLEKIERLLGPIEPAHRSAFAYFLGRELAALGQTEEAEKYWRRALVLPGRDLSCATLAGMELSKRHGTSRPDDNVLEKSDFWPAPATEEE